MDVGQWLKSLGLERYEAAFRENAVDAELLPTLTADDLKDLGATLVGHRRRLLALLWQFFRFHRYRLRFAFPIRNSYPTDIPRKVPLNCQSSAKRGYKTHSPGG